MTKIYINGVLQGSGGGGGTAATTSYDDSSTQFSATNVQNAIEKMFDIGKNKNFGVVKNPTIQDNLDGSVDILEDGVINFSKVEDGDESFYRLNVSGTSGLMLTNNSVNYVYVNYNNGSPIWEKTLNPNEFLIDARKVPVFRITRIGVDLCILNYDEYGASISNKIMFKDIALRSFERQSGIVLSTTATRKSRVSAGKIWFGYDLLDLDENNAGDSGELCEWYPVAGIWTKQTVTEYDSIYYSNGVDRISLTPNRWVAKYFYRTVSETKNVVSYFHGDQHTTFANALAEDRPVPPSVIDGSSVYVGSIIIQQGSTNGTAYSRDWDLLLETVSVTKHDDLDEINQAGVGVLNGHISSGDQTISGKKTFVNGGIEVQDSIVLDNVLTPIDTSNKLYNTGGTLYWEDTPLNSGNPSSSSNYLRMILDNYSGVLGTTGGALYSATHVVNDSSGIYVSSNQSLIYKYNAENPTYDRRVSIGVATSLIQDICLDSDYLYSVPLSEKKIYKYLKSDLSLVSSSTAFTNALTRILSDGTYLYIFERTANVLRKCLVSNYAVQNFVLLTGDVGAFTQDDNYLYIGLTNSNVVYKYLKTDLTLDSSITVSHPCRDIVCDDDYLYVYCCNVMATTGSSLVKIRKSDNVVVQTINTLNDYDIYFPLINQRQVIVLDGDFVYISGGNSDYGRRFLKLNKSNLEIVSRADCYPGFPTLTSNINTIIPKILLTNKNIFLTNGQTTVTNSIYALYPYEK